MQLSPRITAAPDVVARWSNVPVIPAMSTPLPRESLPAVQRFLDEVHGMGRREWEAFAATGGLSPYSATTHAENVARLASGERTVALFDRPFDQLAEAESIAQAVEGAGLLATRYRSTFRGQSVHAIAATPDARTAEALLATQAAVPSVERDIAFGMLLGYEPRDIAFYANREVGYDGVRHLLGT